MRLLWNAGDRIILFGIRPGKIAGNEWIVFDCQTSARGGWQLCPVVTCREARQGESLLFVDHKPCGKPAALFY